MTTVHLFPRRQTPKVVCVWSSWVRAPSFPVVVVIFSFFFGFILAEAEGWSNMNGFYYVTSMLCGLPTPLTDVTPASDEGKFVDIVIAVWSWALIGTVIGIIGGLSIMSDLVAAVEGIGMKLFKSSPLSRQRVAASPAEEVKTGAGEQAERDNLENVGKGDANVGVQMAALAERITVLESLITKQTTMLDTLFATSQA